jgi:hypothetical protein
MGPGPWAEAVLAAPTAIAAATAVAMRLFVNMAMILAGRGLIGSTPCP